MEILGFVWLAPSKSFRCWMLSALTALKFNGPSNFERWRGNLEAARFTELSKCSLRFTIIFDVTLNCNPRHWIQPFSLVAISSCSIKRLRSLRAWGILLIGKAQGHSRSFGLSWAKISICLSSRAQYECLLMCFVLRSGLDFQEWAVLMSLSSRAWQCTFLGSTTADTALSYGLALVGSRFSFLDQLPHGTQVFRLWDKLGKIIHIKRAQCEALTRGG